jgi:N-acetyl-gamma-glutamyl-phosphate reductase common form
MSNKIPTIVLGGTGYVAGELLRLIAGHPQLELAAAVSTSQAGSTIKSVFPHLQNAFGEQRYITQNEVGKFLQGGKVALFSAAPHGASAALIADMLKQADQNGCKLTVVDVSADFRYPDASGYEAVYESKHGAPELLEQFSSGLPEHNQASTPHIGHPGCFATAMLLGAVPLLEMQLTDNNIHAFGITGSTGSGRSPIAGTHHPLRHSNLYAYKPLAHRHAPEVSGICAQVTGTKPVLSFIPHSGPFSRGIHMTLTANLKNELSTAELQTKFSDYYAGKTFIEVVEGTPRIKDVVGSNYAHIGIAAEGSVVAVFIAIDNLVKGAAGGAIQWMNLQLGLEEAAGLTTPGPGWI